MPSPNLSNNNTSESRRERRRSFSTAQPGEHEHRRRRPVDEYSQVMRGLRAGSNPLDAFLPKPIHTAFATQEDEEQLILLLRRHPVTQIGWIVIAVIASIFPVIYNPGSFFTFLPSGYSFAVTIGWYAAVMVFVFQSFLTWYYNVFIITDERVVDVDFISLLYRRITSAKINNIEDVTSTAGGALQTVFDFGTVTVQTAGAKPEIEFNDVPHPNMIVELFNELLLEEEQEEIEGRVN
ncbi:PH domain-containing protein [Candidatus Woesebacteria bacterium]|nr:PH domain-containing protein [Candidatus Woesebacteria bacterium]